MSYVYRLKYTLKPTPGVYTREDIEKAGDVGACDAVLVLSILYPADGSCSVLPASMDGRTGQPLTDHEIAKAWLMLGLSLAKRDIKTSPMLKSTLGDVLDSTKIIEALGGKIDEDGKNDAEVIPPRPSQAKQPEPDDDSEPSLGTCCSCGRTNKVRNIVMLNLEGPTPGKGWGCVVCDLPPDGAICVLCDDCQRDREVGGDKEVIQYVCDGYASDNKRVAIEICTKPFQHDMSKHHGEVAEPNAE